LRADRWELKRTALDVECMMSGVDGESLVRLVIDAITMPEMRGRLEADKVAVVERLVARA
jgi:transcriptional regulator with AAA-type ATPase domain